MHIRFLLIFLCLILVASLPAVSYAQTDLEFSEVTVSLWPEYDKPSMLVIYHFSLPSQISLPATIQLRLPPQAQVNAVASRQPAGDLMNLAHQETIQGDWKVITLTATTLSFQVEYYENLTRDGQVRSYEYIWPAQYAARKFLIEVQQPLGAANMTISPSLGVSTPSSSGLNYFTADQGELAAGQSFKISIQYTNAQDILSASESTIAPSAPIEDASGKTNFMAVLPYLLGIAGLGLIAVSAYWYFVRTNHTNSLHVHSRRQRRSKASQFRQDAASTTNRKEPGSSAEPRYCHQCGHRAGETDRFCRACGTTLR